MRVALLILTALALAVALVLATGGDEESTVQTTTATVTTQETDPAAPETTPSAPPEPDAPADGHGGVEAPRDCGALVFNQNTDFGASAITAVGTSCKTARAVASAAANAADELNYEARGFRCAGANSDEPGLSAIEWFCVGAEREVVTFSTT